MSVTALQASHSESPMPEVSADAYGARVFIPTDDAAYGFAAIGQWFLSHAKDHPGVTLDFAEAVEGGIQFDFLFPGRVL